jgi:hypothetical protein
MGIDCITFSGIAWRTTYAFGYNMVARKELIISIKFGQSIYTGSVNSNASVSASMYDMNLIKHIVNYTDCRCEAVY